MENIKNVLKLLAIGVTVAIGLRTAEWLIPAPEMRVIVCMANDIGKIETCAILKDLVAKHGG